MQTHSWSLTSQAFKVGKVQFKFSNIMYNQVFCCHMSHMIPMMKTDNIIWQLPTPHLGNRPRKCNCPVMRNWTASCLKLARKLLVVLLVVLSLADFSLNASWRKSTSQKICWASAFGTYATTEGNLPCSWNTNGFAAVVSTGDSGWTHLSPSSDCSWSSSWNPSIAAIEIGSLSRINRFNHVTLKLSKKATVVQTNPRFKVWHPINSQFLFCNYSTKLHEDFTSIHIHPEDCIVCSDTPQLMARSTKLTQSRLNLSELSAANHLANRLLIQMNTSKFD